MRKDIYIAPGPNFSGEFDLLSNHGTSSYNALQAQYRHRLSRGGIALTTKTRITANIMAYSAMS